MVIGVKLATAGLVFLANLTALYMCWRIARSAARGLWCSVGDNRPAKLVALLLATMVMREAVTAFVVVVVHALQTMLVFQPIAVVTLTGDPPPALDDLIEAVVRFGGNVVRDGITELRLESLPWISLLVLGALWVAFYFLIARLHHELTTSRRAGERSIVYSSTLFIMILIFGLFLSFAAIIAIPVLQEPAYDSADATPAKLDERLEGLSKNLFDEGHYPKDPFAAPPRRAAPASASADAPVTAGPPAPPTDPTAPVAGGAGWNTTPAPAATDDSTPAKNLPDAATRRSELARWTDMRSSTLGLAQRDRQQAISIFRLGSVGHKANRETAAHFSELMNWYEARTTEYAERLESCLNAIKLVNTMPARDGEPIFAGACNGGIDYVVPPGRRTAGGELGLFSFLAQWLLAAESVPLALVVGMLGFGVLGAAISSFIRERASSSTKEVTALIYDVPRMLVKGMSAAIVLFLGVEGGLAVFSSKDAQPNPYVLFFACFSAAVFSERVWDWAQDKLVSGLASRQGESRSAGGGGDVPPDKPAPPVTQPEPPSPTPAAGDTQPKPT